MFCSFVSCSKFFKIPSPYPGGESRAKSAWEDHREMSWQRWVPLPFIGDAQSTPFAPSDIRAVRANKEFSEIVKVSFIPKPTRQESLLNRNYAERQRESGYGERFVKAKGMWSCNCPRASGQGCSGWRPCPNWIQQCLYCRRAVASWEARLGPNASPEMAYGYTQVFVSDAGELASSPSQSTGGSTRVFNAAT